MTGNLANLNISFASVAPMLYLTGLTLLVLVLDFFVPRRYKSALGYVTVIGLLLVLPSVFMAGNRAPSFGGTVIADQFSAFFNAIYIIAAVFTILISMDYLKKVGAERGEYYYIILFATLGMMVMTSSNDLINVYVGLELMALSFYVLVAFRTDCRRSSEGALKYFILGDRKSVV